MLRTDLGGHHVDKGGQWIGETHHRMLQLLDYLKLPKNESYISGECLFFWGGDTKVSQFIPDFRNSHLFMDPQSISESIWDIEQSRLLRNSFWSIVDSVNPDKPWETPNAAYYDSISPAEWAHKQTTSTFAQSLISWLTRVGGNGGFEPEDSSLLHLAWTQAVSPQDEHPETWLVQDGAGQIAERLTETLSPFIELNKEVDRIEQGSENVSLYIKGCADSIDAKCAIVAIPPNLREKIQFSPNKPKGVQAFDKASNMGSMIKILALYPEAFWRKSGFSGLAQGNSETLQLIADSSPPSGNPGVLAAFVAGNRAVEFSKLPEESRRRLITEELRKHFGSEFPQPTQVLEANWNKEPYTGGAFTTFMKKGGWIECNPNYRESMARIFWAGTEMARKWPGYFEGAVMSGEDAALNALQILSREIAQH